MTGRPARVVAIFHWPSSSSSLGASAGRFVSISRSLQDVVDVRGGGCFLFFSAQVIDFSLIFRHSTHFIAHNFKPQYSTLSNKSSSTKIKMTEIIISIRKWREHWWKKKKRTASWGRSYADWRKAVKSSAPKKDSPGSFLVGLAFPHRNIPFCCVSFPVQKHTTFPGSRFWWRKKRKVERRQIVTKKGNFQEKYCVGNEPAVVCIFPQLDGDPHCRLLEALVVGHFFPPSF
jgi:hypothetical protein